MCSFSQPSAASALSQLESSVVIRKPAPVLRAFLEEGVAAFDRFIGHVRQPGSFAGEDLLADQAIVDRVEGELQHPLRRRALATNDLGPLQSGSLQLVMWHDGIDHAHSIGILCAVGATEKENLPGELLPDLPGEVRRAEPAVE